MFDGCSVSLIVEGFILPLNMMTVMIQCHVQDVHVKSGLSALRGL